LIEVLLALAIFLTALVAIARLVDMGADLELEARHQRSEEQRLNSSH
jgi:Tfp pilus assembly protein PilV